MDPTEPQIRAYDAYKRNGLDIPATCIDLGIRPEALKKTLFNGHLRGLTIPTEYCEHLPAGMMLNAASIHVSKDGSTSGWYKGISFKSEIDAISDYLKTRTPVSKFSVNKPVKFDENHQLEWTLADLHFGLLSWGKETGANYDMRIARELVLDSAADIFSRSGKVKETVLVLMGDNFHADSTENQTRKSHHALDVDSRYQKIIPCGVDTFASAIEICLAHSEKVKVIVLYGNHDETTSQILPWILHYYFLQNPRVEVDLSPTKGRFNFWGVNATIYYHGDTTKPDRICAELMQYIAQNDMTGFRFFHAKQAHLHKETHDDINGVSFERVPSPVAKDSFAAGNSYGSRRATVATVYHKEGGEVYRVPVTVQGLEWKKMMLKNK